jgi:hypothetical protein
MKIAFNIPGLNQPIDSNLPVPTGGLDSTGQKIIQVSLVLIVIIAILFCLFLMLTGGIDIITSTGKKEKYQSGRNKVTYAILGLIMIFASFVFLNIINVSLGVDLLNFH